MLAHIGPRPCRNPQLCLLLPPPLVRLSRSSPRAELGERQPEVGRTLGAPQKPSPTRGKTKTPKKGGRISPQPDISSSRSVLTLAPLSSHERITLQRLPGTSGQSFLRESNRVVLFAVVQVALGLPSASLFFFLAHNNCLSNLLRKHPEDTCQHKKDRS